MRSMTGCGRGQAADGRYQLSCEVRTVNHRFLDVACRLPRNLSFLEDTVRRLLGATLRRGHADVFVTVACPGEGERRVQVDENLAAALSDAARRLAGSCGRPDDLTVSRLLALEGVVTLDDAEMDRDAVTALCEAALGEALRQTDAMRAKEGAALARDLGEHLDAAEALRADIAERAPGVVEDYRARLTARLSRLPVEPVEPQRLAQEVALMADRCAIDEELARLSSHAEQLRGYLTAPGEIGKKMDFLVQEMNREANTIGAKAADARIAQMVVDLKSEIEKLREQIQNVE